MIARLSLLALATHSVASFTFPRTKLARSIVTQLYSQNWEPTTWEKYKHDFIEPMVRHAESPSVTMASRDDEEDDTYWCGEGPIPLEVDERAEISDAYWQQEVAEEKDRLHHMTALYGSPETLRAQRIRPIGAKDSWNHYEHEYIDDLVHREKSPFLTDDPMNAKKRRISQEYWLQSNKENKEKMAKMSGMDMLP